MSFLWITLIIFFGIILQYNLHTFVNADRSTILSILLVLRWLLLVWLTIYALQKGSLTTWILVSMVIGIVIGLDFPYFSSGLGLVSQVFLKLVKSIIAPLIFGTLVVGIAGHSDIKQVGRMGIKALIYFEVVTTIALFIGLAAINLTQAGVGVKVPENVAKGTMPEKKQVWQEVILHIFPENLAKSVAEGQILQVVIFSIIFGIGLAMVADKHRKVMISFCESLSEIMFKYTQVVMYFAPIAVGAAIAFTISGMGLDVLVNLFQLLLTLYAALIFFILIVLLPVALVVRLPIGRFVKAVSEPVSLAFATASSESALPKAMKAMESIGVPRKIVAFVMPTGYSFNLDGSTLYLSLAAVFVSQAAGVPLSFQTQIIMVLTLMLTSKGVAGVPRASLVILLGTVESFNLPTWPVLVIFSLDTLMDMARSAVNLLGNCLATVVVARWEGEYDPNVNPNEGLEEAEEIHEMSAH
jgi:proton glutamate symport protein